MARTILDFALPFGLRSAACIFNTLADLFVWALQNNYYVEDLLHYLDDFFALGPTGSDVCAESLKSIQRASTDSAIPLAPEKCEGPSTCLVFLGIELDSIQITARPPQDKLDDLTLIIRKWATKKWRTRNSLESLVSRLNHACSVVAHGRTFLRRLINLLRDSKRHQKFLRLNKECRLDLQWWNQFLPVWNGISFFDLPNWAPVPDFELATDASGSLCFCALHQGEWVNAA